jgi:hypothetical protein
MVVAPTGETNGRHAQRHGSVDWRRPASLHGLQGSNPARGWNQVSVVPTRAIRNRRRLRRKRPLEPPRVRQPPMVERATPSEALASRCASPKQLRALCARLVRQSGGRRPAGAGTAAKSPQRSATSRSLSSAPVQPETPKEKAQLRQRQSPGPEYCAQPRRHTGPRGWLNVPWNAQRAGRPAREAVGRRGDGEESTLPASASAVNARAASDDG